jgi:ubiquitin-protein ligase
MTVPREKRLLAEINRWAKADDEDLQKLGIKLQYDENDLTKSHAAIMGPKDSPYFGGFFGFEISYPDQYPFEPLMIRFLNPNGKVRFNPNLYNGGKVCLSIINTWSGPTWESHMTTRSVLITLMAHIFHSQPIRNEPGYEKKTDEQYNRFLQYATLRYATSKSLPSGPLRDWATTHTRVTEYIDELKAMHPVNALVTCFGGSLLLDFSAI